jgi:hypothetical protein
MRNGFGVLAALRVGDRQHVEGVVVVGIFVTDQPQVGNGFVVASAVDGQRGCVEPLVDGLRRGFTGFDQPLADVQVQPYALVQLLLLRVEPQDRLEQRNGRRAARAGVRKRGASAQGFPVRSPTVESAEAFSFSAAGAASPWNSCARGECSRRRRGKLTGTQPIGQAGPFRSIRRFLGAFYGGIHLIGRSTVLFTQKGNGRPSIKLR